MAGKLEGKVALITGGASGMGEAEARLFSKEGASVMIADVQTERAEGVVSDITADGGNAAYVQLDVREWDSGRQRSPIRRAVWQAGHPVQQRRHQQARRLHGPVDRRVQDIVDVNLHGTYLGCRSVKDAMRRAGGGAILNIGSMSSLKHTSSTGYTVSKTGILALTKNVAWHFAEDMTRCNVICPGPVDTPFIREDNPHSHNDWSTTIENPENYEKRKQGVPLGRLQTPLDIAKAGLFLCSDDAEMITGAVLTVDGGSALK